MKNTLMNKFVVVISLWLAAIAGISAFVAFKTNVLAFYIIFLIFIILLVGLNALHISLLIRKALHIQPKAEEKYKNY